jgi:hypothetical protein
VVKNAAEDRVYRPPRREQADVASATHTDMIVSLGAIVCVLVFAAAAAAQINTTTVIASTALKRRGATVKSMRDGWDAIIRA